MSYIQVDKKYENQAQTEHGLLNRNQIVNRKDDIVYFYEYETAVVLDVILDENHPIFKTNKTKIDITEFPGKPIEGDIDYSWIGKSLVRLIVSEEGKEKSTLSWAIPIGTDDDYPLVNELVYVVSYMGELYYGKLNTKNHPNHNADLRYEKKYGLNDGLKYDGKISFLRNKQLPDTVNNFGGSIGKYFTANDNIRRLKRYEGDKVFESRFGQSIRMGAYTNDPTRDDGDPNSTTYAGGGGNPMLLIRNRQRPIDGKSEIEKNVGGRILEDINLDGSSIHMTSGLTKSNWNRNIIVKRMFGEKPEYSQFCPAGSTDFKFPKLDGDQIVVQSGRLLFSSRERELLLFGKSRISATTDGELTLDSKGQIVITSLKAVHVNSPKIYLGDYANVDEPIVLGTQASKWMYDVINWLKTHIHVVGKSTTGVPVQMQELIELQDRIPKLMSDRVFTPNRGKSPT